MVMEPSVVKLIRECPHVECIAGQLTLVIEFLVDPEIVHVDQYSSWEKHTLRLIAQMNEHYVQWSSAMQYPLTVYLVQKRPQLPGNGPVETAR